MLIKEPPALLVDKGMLKDFKNLVKSWYEILNFIKNYEISVYDAKRKQVRSLENEFFLRWASFDCK